LGDGLTITFGRVELILLHHPLAAVQLREQKELRHLPRRHLHLRNKLLLREILEAFLKSDKVHIRSSP
jgi:hypothetical protein